MSRDLKDLLLEVREKAECLLAASQQKGIRLIVTHTLRTFKEQQDLYEIGRTRKGRIVTFAPPGYSWHNWKRAFDVAIATFPGDKTPKDLYDGPWTVLGDLGESCGLEWGGRWKTPDRPHFQDTGGLSLGALRKLHPQGLS